MDLLVPATRCSSLGDRSVPVAAARAWNALHRLATDYLFRGTSFVAVSKLKCFVSRSLHKHVLLLLICNCFVKRLSQLRVELDSRSIRVRFENPVTIAIRFELDSSNREFSILESNRIAIVIRVLESNRAQIVIVTDALRRTTWTEY